jgi:hypothetical protein
MTAVLTSRTSSPNDLGSVPMKFTTHRIQLAFVTVLLVNFPCPRCDVAAAGIRFYSQIKSGSIMHYKKKAMN